MSETLSLKEAKERFEARSQGGLVATSSTSSGSSNPRYPYQDEAEEQILRAIKAMIEDASRDESSPLSEIENVLTGERTDDTPRMPHVWLQDGEVRAVDGTASATTYEMDFMIRAFVVDYTSSDEGQRTARRLATRVRDQLLKKRDLQRRLNLNFVLHIKPWRSQRMGEVNENTYAHYSAVRITFMARE